MHRKIPIILSILVFSTTLYGVESDAQIVQTILDVCELGSLTVKDVAVIENGRVIKLNLANREISKDGIIEIPEMIGELTELKEMIFTGNLLREIPVEIGKLVKLEILDLGSNEIRAIPPEIGLLKHLIKLDLRHNEITELPFEIGDLENLEYLYLWGNRITQLNPAITKLYRLRELYLKDNRLTTLPVGMIRLRLQYIDFIGNKLCNLSSLLDIWVRRFDKNYKQSQRCQ